MDADRKDEKERDDVLRRMLSTPPQPRPKERKSPEKKAEPKG